jgi:hypothetical protein
VPTSERARTRKLDAGGAKDERQERVWELGIYHGARSTYGRARQTAKVCDKRRIVRSKRPTVEDLQRDGQLGRIEHLRRHERDGIRPGDESPGRAGVEFCANGIHVEAMKGLSAEALNDCDVGVGWDARCLSRAEVEVKDGSCDRRNRWCGRTAADVLSALGRSRSGARRHVIGVRTAARRGSGARGECEYCAYRQASHRQ